MKNNHLGKTSDGSNNVVGTARLRIAELQDGGEKREGGIEFYCRRGNSGNGRGGREGEKETFRVSDGWLCEDRREKVSEKRKSHKGSDQEA